MIDWKGEGRARDDISQAKTEGKVGKVFFSSPLPLFLSFQDRKSIELVEWVGSSSAFGSQGLFDPAPRQTITTIQQIIMVYTYSYIVEDQFQDGSSKIAL